MLAVGATATSSRTRIVLCRHGVNFRALLVQGRTVEAYEECSAEDPVATREALSRIRALASSSASVTALFGPNSQQVHWIDGASTQRPESLTTAIRGQSAGAASNDARYGLADAATLGVVQAGRPAVHVSAAVAELEPYSDWLTAARFDPTALLSSTLAHVAAAVAALQAENSTERVALWDSCGASGAIWLVSASGVAAVVPCPATWSSVVEAVQRALNLRATSTVSKLLFNDLFDFSDVAPRVAETLAADLRPALAGFPQAATAWQILGRAPRHAWLEKALAQALDLAEWQPDATDVGARFGFTLAGADPSTLPAAVYPLLHALSSVSREEDSAWQWQDEADLPAPRTIATALTQPPRVTLPTPNPIKPFSAPDIASDAPTASPAPAARTMVQIGNRRLMLAPSGPSPLTGWPHPVRARQAQPDEDEFPRYPVGDEPTSTATLPADDEALSSPDASAEDRSGESAEPESPNPKRRRWCVAIAVFILIAAASLYQLRPFFFPTEWEMTSPPFQLAEDVDSTASIIAVEATALAPELTTETEPAEPVQAPVAPRAEIAADAEAVLRTDELEQSLIDGASVPEPTGQGAPPAVIATPLLGRLVLRSEPAGAMVYLDGVMVGRTPLELTEQPVGPFKALLSLDGFEELHVGGELYSGETTELTLPLTNVDRLAKVHELVEPPAATRRVAPDFRRLPYVSTGHVLLSFVIDRRGTPVGVRVEQTTDQRLVQPCLDAFAQWQFSPGINRDGRPVNTRVHQLFQIAPGRR